MLALAAIIAVASTMLLVFTSPRFSAPLPRAPQHTVTVPVHDGMVAVPLDVLRDQVSFFESEIDGTTVRFIVTTGRDGPSVYRDACNECAHAQRGYRSEEGRLICNQCGKGFSLHAKFQASECSPLAVTAGVKRGKLIILAVDLHPSAVDERR